ncbi:hypothetical protein CEE44_01075 [Candidatus Woesearchaeota archaeon B3_Woes]|nr:MAG: hypothetical protein CEE44_01075 [Candidatus Woesearchaeota archaeon B3_Woes]
MANTRGTLSILACESGEPFANKVLEVFKEKEKEVRFIDSKQIQFANSEIKTIIEESIRGTDIYIFQDVENSTNGSVDENLRALKTAVETAWRCDASYITAVVPVFPYARQDKQIRRESITAAAVAREIEDSNADHVITLDIHNPAIEGYFRRAKFENLRAYKTLVDYIKSHPDDFDFGNIVVMAPDLGGATRAGLYANQLGVEPVFSYKKRDGDNSVKSIQIIGEVKDRDVLIVDDMIDTAGTIMEAVRASKDAGAQRVYASCSLPLFNGDALEKIAKSYDDGFLTAVISTDAVYHGADFQQQNPWFREVSVASYFAKVIRSMNNRESISALLK